MKRARVSAKVFLARQPVPVRWIWMIRELKDADGIRLVDALSKHGIDFEQVKASGRELKMRAHLEL